MVEMAEFYGHSGNAGVMVACPDPGRQVYTGLNLGCLALEALDNEDADLIDDGLGD